MKTLSATPNKWGVVVKQNSVLIFALSASLVLCLVRFLLKHHVSPTSDYGQTWYGDGDKDQYIKNGVYFYLVGFLKSLGLTYFAVAGFLFVFSFILFLAAIALLERSVLNTFGNKLTLILVYLSALSFWFFSGFQLEPRILSMSFFALGAAVLNLNLKYDQAELSLFRKTVPVFFFVLAVNVQNQILLSFLIFAAFLILVAFKYLYPRIIYLTAFFTIFVSYCLNLGFNAFSGNKRAIDIANNSALFFGINSPEALESCGTWTANGSILLNKISTFDMVSQTFQVFDNLNWDLASCKIQKMFLTLDSNNVLWVYNLGNDSPLQFSRTGLLPLFLYALLFSGLLTYLSMTLFLTTNWGKLSVFYLVVSVISVAFFTIVLELNSRYFFSYMLPIPILGLIISQNHIKLNSQVKSWQ